MLILEILMLSVGLAADAFAVSVCKGLSVRTMKARHAVICGLYFGGFQALMPLAGYWLGRALTSFFTENENFDDGIIATVCSIIAFVLLVLIGANMIREALGKDEDECDCCFGPKAMLPLAVATSIDAFAVGVALALKDAADGSVNIFLQVAAIGLVTFILSAVGVKIGNIFGAKFKKTAELAGGIILIVLGIKFLLEGLGVL